MLHLYQVHLLLFESPSFFQTNKQQKTCKNAVGPTKFAAAKPESFGSISPRRGTRSRHGKFKDNSSSAVLSAVQGVEHQGSVILVKLLPLLLGDNEDIVKEEEVHLLFRSSFRKKSSVFDIRC